MRRDQGSIRERTKGRWESESSLVADRMGNVSEISLV